MDSTATLRAPKSLSFNMQTVMLDSNIFDRLDKDEAAQNNVRIARKNEQLRIVISPDIHRELQQGPFRGVPPFFPVVVMKDARAPKARSADIFVSEDPHSRDQLAASQACSCMTYEQFSQWVTSLPQ